MRSKKITIFLCLLMVTAIFTVAVPGSATAKPAEPEDIDEKETISIHAIWKDDGYYVIVSGPKELNVYLVIIDKNGEKTYSEMKYDKGEYSAWISNEIAKNKNDIYITIIEASESLLPNDKGTIPALSLQVIDIDIKGKKDRVRLTTTTVLESKLLLETVYDDKVRTVDNKDLLLRDIARHGVRKGAGPGSVLDLTHTIEFQIPTPDFNVDSFFDVFYEIDFHPPEPGSEVEVEVDSFFDITYELKSDDLTIDSFFDVCFERSNKGTDFHVDSYIDVDDDDEWDPIIPESFFDLSMESGFDLPYPGRLGGDFVSESNFHNRYRCDWRGHLEIDRENPLELNTKGSIKSDDSGGISKVNSDNKYVALGLGSISVNFSSQKLMPISVLNTAEGAVVEKESFFDVFTEFTLGPGPHEQGGDDNYADSFFDVFTELSFNPYIVSDPTVPGKSIDSFFDVFTELSIDGNGWDLVAINDNGYGITAEDDWEAPNAVLDSFFDVFTSFEPEWFAETLPDDDLDFHIDSFFDVFTELSLETSTNSFFYVFVEASTDSFFDVFVESSTDSFFDVFAESSTDSFFDVFVESDKGGGQYDFALGGGGQYAINLGGGGQYLFALGGGGQYAVVILPEGDGGKYNADSFFDVFFDITIEDVEPQDDSGTIETEIVSLSLSGAIATELVSMDLTGGGDFAVDSFFDVFVELDTGNGQYHIDSFFDVVVETSTGGGLYHIDSFFDVFVDMGLYGEVDFSCAWSETLSIPEGFAGGEFLAISLKVCVDYAANSKNNSPGDPDRSLPGFYSIQNLSATLDGITIQISLMQSFSYTGIEMQTNDTTIAGDKYTKDPLQVECYGTINLTFKYKPAQDNTSVTIASYDMYHRLTRGTNSRTWGDGNTSVFQEVIWNVTTVIRWAGGDDDDDDTGGGLYHIDSFFDVFFDITVTDEDPQGDTGTFGTDEFAIYWTLDMFEDVTFGADKAPPGTGGGGLYHIDSFFDITYEIPPDYEYKIPDDKISKINDSIRIAKTLLNALNSGDPKDTSQYKVWYEDLYRRWYERRNYTLSGNYSPEDFRGVLELIVSGSTNRPLDALVSGLISNPYGGASIMASYTNYFESNLDMYAGNSGTMVISMESENYLSNDTITIAGFDLFHRLTRGTNSRTWGNGTTAVHTEFSCRSSTVINWGGDDDDDDTGDDLYHIDSFFDVFYDTSGHDKGLDESPFLAGSANLELTSDFRIVGEAEGDWPMPVAMISNVLKSSTVIDLTTGLPHGFNAVDVDLEVSGIFSPGGWGLRVGYNETINSEADSVVTITTRLSTDYYSNGSTFSIDSFFDVFTELGVESDVTSTLKIRGDIKGEYKPGNVDFTGKLSVDSSFTYKKDNITATLKAGAKLTVKVEKNEFKGAELTGVEITTSVTINDSEFNLEGSVTGSINEAYEVSFDGSIELKNDVEKDFGESVKVGIAAGAKLTVHVQTNEFESADLTVDSFFDVTYEMDDPDDEDDDDDGDRIDIRGSIATNISLDLGDDDDGDEADLTKMDCSLQTTVNLLDSDYGELSLSTDMGVEFTTAGSGDGNDTGMISIIVDSSMLVSTSDDDDDDDTDMISMTVNSSMLVSTSDDDDDDARLISITINRSMLVHSSDDDDDDSTMDSFFDVFVDVFVELDSGGGGQFQIDSFFDVFVETSTGGGLYHIDSFFDVFVETDLGGGGQYHIDSFFDVFVELDSGGGGQFHIDSFFDVFVEIDLPGQDIPAESFFDITYNLAVDDSEPVELYSVVLEKIPASDGEEEPYWVRLLSIIGKDKFPSDQYPELDDEVVVYIKHKGIRVPVVIGLMHSDNLVHHRIRP